MNLIQQFTVTTCKGKGIIDATLSAQSRDIATHEVLVLMSRRPEMTALMGEFAGRLKSMIEGFRPPCSVEDQLADAKAEIARLRELVKEDTSCA